MKIPKPAGQSWFQSIEIRKVITRRYPILSVKYLPRSQISWFTHIFYPAPQTFTLAPCIPGDDYEHKELKYGNFFTGQNIYKECQWWQCSWFHYDDHGETYYSDDQDEIYYYDYYGETYLASSSIPSLLPLTQEALYWQWLFNIWGSKIWLYNSAYFIKSYFSLNLLYLFLFLMDKYHLCHPIMSPRKI